MEESSNKRLAKNTLILYIRMFITMMISLYTSRIVLNALGVDDYGLYNVIAGVVAMTSVFTAGMASATQRFLSYELGLKNREGISKIFSSCVEVHILLAFLLFVFAEVIGLWLLYNKLQIPDGRIDVAFWLLQFSLLSICISLITIPYSAFIISFEKMNIYAYISIFDAICKLIIAFLVSQVSCDKLLLYGLLLSQITVLNLIIYYIYCKLKHPETHFSLIWDKAIIKRIFSFTSWTILGQGGMVIAIQGTNILMNIFHTVAANASLGIANQVNSAIKGLSGNFFTAFQPQITKSYAVGDYSHVIRLTNSASKMSFFLIYIVSLPIILNIGFLLKIWLGIVPQYADLFCIIIVVSTMFDVIGNPFWVCVYASGKIKKMQVFSFCIFILELLLFGVACCIGLSPYIALLVKIIGAILLLCIRVKEGVAILQDYKINSFFSDIVFPILITTFVSTILGLGVKMIMNDDLLLNVISIFLIVILSAIVAYFLGLTKHERSYTRMIIKEKIRRKKGNENV